MHPALKTRLLGAVVLIALLVIVVPLFFSGKPGGGGSQSISLDIPQAPDETLRTRTLSVAPPSARTTASAPVSNDRLATVDIASRVPPEVRPDAAPEQPAAQPAPDAASSGETEPARQAAAPSAAGQPSAGAAEADAAPEDDPGRAAVGRYLVTLGAYADKANAADLMAKVEKLGYPVQLQGVDIDGKPAARVNVGPFDSRAAAESARLKLASALPHAPAELLSSPADQGSNAPARPSRAPAADRAGGWAVQVVAYSKRADADRLRDKLRAAGFDGYVDDVKSGGQTLWRVRVGPQARRSDALSVQKRLKGKFPRLNGVVVSVP